MNGRGTSDKRVAIITVRQRKGERPITHSVASKPHAGVCG